MTSTFRKTAAQAAIFAIERLSETLNQAHDYLSTGDDMAAWGTLLMFDEAADDLKAAMRLHRIANRREQ
jgi:hypothetical protein